MTRDRAAEVSQALAWGFLAAPAWTRRGLRAAGRRTLGCRPAFLAAVVERVLAAYRRPPVDRPAELARYLLADEDLVEAVALAAARGPALRVRRIPARPGRMGPRRWPVPPVDGLPAFARLLEVPLEQLPWLGDLKGLQRRAPDGPLHLYRYRWVARPGAVPRLLESPTPLLRHVLRRLLDSVLAPVPVHPAAHGFVPGRSALTHARAHVGADLLVCLDLRHFFATVSGARVAGIFRTLGYPEAVAAAMTGLVTHRTPVAVLSRMPAGGDSSGRQLLKARLRTAHLPQGVPTSPALANLACFGLDVRLAGYAQAAGARYGRYADDLTFSGPAELAAPRLVRAVAAIVAEEGFALNPAKTRVQRHTARQQVTGLVVNTGLGVPREVEDRLRAVLHDAARRGPQVANRAAVPDFRAHLEGRVSWVEAVNPVRGARLRRQLDAVSWSQR